MGITLKLLEELGTMAAASSNRFMSLSSPKSSPAASRSTSPSRADASERSRSRSTSPSRSDASQQSRSLSPSPSEVRQPYRSIASRIDTYPESWTYKDLSPRLLASCGFCYYRENDKDACICRECNYYATVQTIRIDNDPSPNYLLGFHTLGCL